MKFLLISDLYDCDTKRLSLTLDLIENYDYCICLGDIPFPCMEIISSKIPNNLLGIRGDHDFYQLEDLNVESIHMKTKELSIGDENLTIGGFEGSWRYKDGSYPLYTDEESIRLLSILPKVDILFTHDTYKNYDNSNWAHPGLKGITKYIEEKKPQMNIFGHYHEGKTSKYNDTIIWCIDGIVLLEITNEAIKAKYF